MLIKTFAGENPSSKGFYFTIVQKQSQLLMVFLHKKPIYAILIKIKPLL